jgi:hypothetical protein
VDSVRADRQFAGSEIQFAGFTITIATPLPQSIEVASATEIEPSIETSLLA